MSYSIVNLSAFDKRSIKSVLTYLLTHCAPLVGVIGNTTSFLRGMFYMELYRHHEFCFATSFP